MTRMMMNVFFFALVLLAAACGVDNQNTPATSAAAKELTPEARIEAANLDRLEKDLESLRIGRRTAASAWEAAVRRGDSRGINGVREDLGQARMILNLVEKLAPSDRAGAIRSEAYKIMVEDARVLFQLAQAKKDIWALDSALDFGRELDVNPEEYFGVKAEDLRKEALTMAKKWLTESRPLNSDGLGGLVQILDKWSFTAVELGLTAAELKELGR